MKIPGTGGTYSPQSGASLIEVLVSLLILAIGLLGIAGIQAGALRNNQGALEQSAAVLLTHSIVEAMRASMTSAAAEAEDRSVMQVRPDYSNAAYLCKTSDVTAGGVVGNDLRRWVENLQASLGAEACGKVVCGATAVDANLCEVSIKWNNSRALGGDAAQVITTRSRL